MHTSFTYDIYDIYIYIYYITSNRFLTDILLLRIFIFLSFISLLMSHFSNFISSVTISLVRNSLCLSLFDILSMGVLYINKINL